MTEDVILTLEWARIALYGILPGSTARGKPWGVADETKPILMGSDAESLRLVDSFEQVERRPTGIPYPERRHLSRRHSIEIERVMILRSSDSAVDEYDYVIVPNRLMVLVLIWWEGPPRAENDASWFSRTYFGVTASEHNLQGSADSVSFSGSQALDAMFYKRSHGKGVPPKLP